YSLALQMDGMIIIGGWFTNVGGVPRNRLARLNRDGTVDLAFNTDIGGTGVPDVRTISLRQDGRIVIGGKFATVNGISCSNLAQLNFDGTLDRSFHPNPNDTVNATR